MVKEARISREMGRNWDYVDRQEDFGSEEDDLDEGELMLRGRRRREKEGAKDPTSRNAKREGRGGEWKRDRDNKR